MNISRNGTQVLLPQRLSVLGFLHVALHLSRGVVSTACEVVWGQLSRTARPGEGYRHGLRFIGVGVSERERLDCLLEEIGG